MRSKCLFSARIIAILLVLFAFFLSIGVRLESFTQKTGAQGLEATYHVLWTSRTLDHSSADGHYFLPTVTLIPKLGNPFKWGATVESKGGSYIYTSFPPLGFIIPEILFDWRPDGLDFLTLALFNSLIGLVAAVGLGGLARAVMLSFRSDGESRGRSEWAIFALISILYLFLRESLVSHGSVYWPHSLAQLMLIFGAWMAFRVFQGCRDFLTISMMIIACFLYPALEWTGFIFGLGVSGALLVDWSNRRHSSATGTSVNFGALAPALWALFATVLAGVALIVHFSIAIGWTDLLLALTSRVGARSFRIGAALGLLPGYATSFGALVPIAVFAGLHLQQSKMFPLRQNRAAYLLLFIVSFPMLENFLLMQHAYQFSFDRLKLAVPMLLLLAIYFERMGYSERPLYLFSVAYLVISSNLQLFGYDALYYRPWGEINLSNKNLVDEFDKDPRSGCVLLGSTTLVRGYLNFTFNRDIVESTNFEELLALAKTDERYCGVGLIATRNEFVDLPTILSIELADRTGSVLRTFDALRNQHL